MLLCSHRTSTLDHQRRSSQVIPPAVHDTSIDEALQLAAERGDLAARQTCMDCFADPPPAEELVLVVDQGAVVNWEAYETLCHYIFYQQVVVDACSIGCAVLIVQCWLWCVICL